MFFMGLIRAATSAISSTISDQFKEYFAVDSMDQNVLMCRGRKVTQRRSGNSGSDNVISDGSGISVADGQCAIIVEQGRIVELCAESGVFTYHNSTSPSIFTGTLEDGVRNTFQTMFQRFTMGGGSVGADQRVYYFNLKEIMENRYGTPTPIPFRVVGRNQSFDLDTSVKCNGQYSYQIIDPILFYANVSGNVSHEFRRNEIDSTLKSELLTALQPTFGKISAKGVRPSDLPAYTMEIADLLNEILTKSWVDKRGLKIVSFAINSVSIPEEDQKKIQQLQLNETPNLAAANLAAAQAEALVNASKNSSGALHGFMGMNMANGMGGMNLGGLYQVGAEMQEKSQQLQQNSQKTQQLENPQVLQNQSTGNHWTCDCGTENTSKFCAECGKSVPISSENTWICGCGTENHSKFCCECGKPQPVSEEGWACSCGSKNLGKFCSECGKGRPSGAPLYRCDKCGFNPPNPKKPPRFCPECGDVFDVNDKI